MNDPLQIPSLLSPYSGSLPCVWCCLYTGLGVWLRVCTCWCVIQNSWNLFAGVSVLI